MAGQNGTPGNPGSPSSGVSWPKNTPPKNQTEPFTAPGSSVNVAGPQTGANTRP